MRSGLLEGPRMIAQVRGVDGPGRDAGLNGEVDLRKCVGNVTNDTGLVGRPRPAARQKEARRPLRRMGPS
jgi:hypothetical protein